MALLACFRFTLLGVTPVADLPAVTIDRESPVPYYFQLKEFLAGEISSGRWAIGWQLPSEPALSGHFGVSRATVRQALAELENEGLIRTERGKGTFVSRPRSSWLIQSKASFYEEATRLGHAVHSRVLLRELGKLPDWAAQALELPRHSDGVRLERVRDIDGRTVMYVQNYLPGEYAAPVFEADLESSSLYAALHGRGLRIAGGRRVLDAEAADDRLAGLLRVGTGTPVLFVESVSWDASGRAFECYRAWHITNRARVEVRIAPDEATDATGAGAPVRPPTTTPTRRRRR